MLNKIATYLVFTALTISSLSINAQQFGDNVVNAKVAHDSSMNNSYAFRPDIRVSLGSSFTSFGPGYNMFGSYIAPEINLPVAKKFSVQVGMSYSNLFLNHQGQSLFGNSSAQYGSLYVSGTYGINEKLSVRGTGYKTFLLNPPATDSPQGTPDFSNQGIAFDVNYEVSDHFQINVGFQYRQQNYPSYLYGYPQTGYSMPVHANPGFGGFGTVPNGF